MDGEIAKEVWTRKTQEIETQTQMLENKLKSMKLPNEQFIDVGNNIIEYSKQAYNMYKNKI